MTDLFDRIAARALRTDTVARPRLAARFEHDSLDGRYEPLDGRTDGEASDGIDTISSRNRDATSKSTNGLERESFSDGVADRPLELPAPSKPRRQSAHLSADASDNSISAHSRSTSEATREPIPDAAEFAQTPRASASMVPPNVAAPTSHERGLSETFDIVIGPGVTASGDMPQVERAIFSEDSLVRARRIETREAPRVVETDDVSDARRVLDDGSDISLKPRSIARNPTLGPQAAKPANSLPYAHVAREATPIANERISTSASATDVGAPTVVHVRIGRIDVRMDAPAAPTPRARATSAGPRLNLDDYLRSQKHGG